mmetsp:Transcript_2711/g.9872  ORF Transcript_2711/g.9872 Transcript_2711/m.9872 type:complete len:254 (+) Transcript_2711:2877-3638(+)
MAATSCLWSSASHASIASKPCSHTLPRCENPIPIVTSASVMKRSAAVEGWSPEASFAARFSRIVLRCSESSAATSERPSSTAVAFDGAAASASAVSRTATATPVPVSLPPSAVGISTATASADEAAASAAAPDESDAAVSSSTKEAATGTKQLCENTELGGTLTPSEVILRSAPKMLRWKIWNPRLHHACAARKCLSAASASGLRRGVRHSSESRLMLNATDRGGSGDPSSFFSSSSARGGTIAFRRKVRSRS